MRKFLMLAFIAFVSALTFEASAIVFINEKAPGVRQVINPKTGEKEWRNSNGDFLGNAKDCLPMTEMDKYDYAYDSKDQKMDGYHNVIVDPEKNGIKKVWDSERKCYVWKDSTGNYLGRVPDFPDDQKWIKDNMKDVWNQQGLTPAAAKRYEESMMKMLKEADKEFDQIEANVDGEREYSDEEIDAMINGADNNLNEGEAAINEALNALHELGMSEYDGLLKNAKGQIQKGKNATKNRPKK